MMYEIYAICINDMRIFERKILTKQTSKENIVILHVSDIHLNS